MYHRGAVPSFLSDDAVSVSDEISCRDGPYQAGDPEEEAFEQRVRTLHEFQAGELAVGKV